MRIFYNQSVDAIARRLIPGIAVAALAAWGVASGGAVLEDIPELTSKAQAANLPVRRRMPVLGRTARGRARRRATAVMLPSA